MNLIKPISALFLLITILGCFPSIEKSKDSSKTEKELIIDSTYFIKYAGKYMSLINGKNVGEGREVYKLQNNGTADWIWISVENNKEYIDDSRSGTWEAFKDSIVILIPGSIEMIKETYLFKTENEFESELMQERSIKKIE